MQTKTIYDVQRTSLNMNMEEFRAAMERMGAEIRSPVSVALHRDPIAIKDGRVIAFWVE
jgi:hypothetical protein